MPIHLASSPCNSKWVSAFLDVPELFLEVPEARRYIFLGKVVSKLGHLFLGVGSSLAW